MLKRNGGTMGGRLYIYVSNKRWCRVAASAQNFIENLHI